MKGSEIPKVRKWGAEPWVYRSLVVAVMIIGCDAENDVDGSTDAPSYEELRESAAVVVAEKPAFVVEGDLLFHTEEQLGDYYDDVYGSSFRSIVNVVGGMRDVRADPMNITYCFVAGWGQNQGSYTAPSQAGVQNNIQLAMQDWEAAGGVHFVHRADLDGANCSTTGTDPVSFAVRHIPTTGGINMAFGAFPSFPPQDQFLSVPPGGISYRLAIHEVGHILGLRHEHIHSGASPRCVESGDWEELTAYDDDSAMVYNNCTSSSVIGNNLVSPLDAQGLQELYGPPGGPVSLDCDLNGAAGYYGGFGIHNATVQNTSSAPITGWSVEIDFGSATPDTGWSWGATTTDQGNKIIVSGTGTLQPGQQATFGLGGNYSGPTYVSLSCQ